MTRLFIILFFTVTSLPVFAHKDKWDEHKSEWSPLMLAIYNGQTSKFLKLIKQNVDVNYNAIKNESEFQLTALDVAIRIDNENAINALLKTNKILNINKSLMTACAYERAATINLLIKYGANPSYTNKFKHSVGMLATSSGSLEVLKALLDNGADINQTRGVGGMTMLMFAASHGDVAKVKLLLEYGANKSIRTNKSETAFDYVNRIYPRYEVTQETKAELRELLK